MFELDQRIAEQLTQVSLGSSVQVRMSASNSFAITASTMIPLMQMFEMGGVYISASRGAVEIIQAFEAIGVLLAALMLMHAIKFADCAMVGFSERIVAHVCLVDPVPGNLVWLAKLLSRWQCPKRSCCSKDRKSTRLNSSH